MSKPDWCPQRVWEMATAHADKWDGEFIGSYPKHDIACEFASAILAAEQREREACAVLAQRSSSGAYPAEIATAIRNRGSSHD